MSTEIMQSLAKTADKTLNPNGRMENGFVILAFPFDQPEGQRTNYVSNAERESIIIALKEIIARFEGRAHDQHPTNQ